MFYQKQIAECDRQIGGSYFKALAAGPEDTQAPQPPISFSKRGGVNTPQIAGLHSLLYRLCGGKDPTSLPGVADHVLLQLVGGTGHRTCKSTGRPRNSLRRIRGWHQAVDRVASGGVARSAHANGPGACSAVIARSVGRSVDKALGGFYRRLKSRRGGLVANIALAQVG